MSEDMNQEQGLRINNEVIQSHGLMKWVVFLLVSNIAVVTLGGMKIYVNDDNQDKRLDTISSRLLNTPTREEVKLLDKLVLAEIKSTKAINKNTKDSLDRVAAALFSMKNDIAELKVHRK